MSPGLDALLAQPDRLRNFCMLAHVDHGKTTLSDVLIASNGIISPAMAGKLRFMDTREDEQARQITMKVSSILLTCSYEGNPYLLNLLDSPGHIDFSAEVSTAVRLADGGIVVVDVVDGVGIQTEVVLQQAFRERIQMCLVLNKVDLLFTTLRLSPEEAYQELASVLANVNAIVSSLVNAEQIERAGAATDQDRPPEEEGLPADDYFMPHNGNVVFASAIHGWGFATDDFAAIWAEKLQCSRKALCRALWGEHYLEVSKGKEPRIARKPPKPGHAPMFVKFCLEPIAQMYDAILTHADEARVLQMIEKLKLTKLRRSDVRMKDPDATVKAVLSAWLPLAGALSGMVVRQVPPPPRAQRIRLPLLFPDLYTRRYEGSEYHSSLRAALETADQHSPFTVVYVGKMYEVDSLGIHLDHAAGTAAGSDQLLAFSRVLCGTLRRGQRVHVISANTNDRDRPEVEIGSLYLPQGRDMLPVDAVPAGCICSIRGLQSSVLKTATLATDPRTPACKGMAQPAAPIVHFVVSPKNQFEMHKLHAGIQLLHKADSQVEFVMRDVEVIVKAAGQVHAQLCLKDLEEVFAKIQLNISDPIVALKETITLDEKVRSLRQMEQERVTLFTPNKQFRITIHAVPLPATIRAFLEAHEKALEDLCSERAQAGGRPTNPEALEALEGLSAAFAGVEGPARKRWVAEWPKVWALGPKQYGACVLLNHCERYLGPTVWTPLAARLLRHGKSLGPSSPTAAVPPSFLSPPGAPSPEAAAAPGAPTASGGSTSSKGASASSASTLPPRSGAGDDTTPSVCNSHSLKDTASGTHRSDDHLETGSVETEQAQEWKAALFREAFEYVNQGFQQATLAGPMCGEPMVGVAFVVDDLDFYQTVEQATAAFCHAAVRKAKARLGIVDAKHLDLTEEQEAVLEAERKAAAEQVAGSFGKFGSHGAQVITCVRQACLEAFALQPRRLVEPIYRVQIVVRGDHSGKVYAALQRKRAEVVDEILREGTAIHLIEAFMPVAESFTFTQDLWARTGGAAHAQLQFGHWAMLDEDPYWVPRTQDDKEEFGMEAKSQPTNVANRLLQLVRKQKGLHTEGAVVQEGEKMKKYSTSAT